MIFLDRTETEIGILGSIVFFPSLITSIVMVPIVELFGPLTCGIVFSVACVVLTIPMLIFFDNFYALLIFRLFFGVFTEPSWLVQAAIVTDYMPSQF